MPPSLRPLLPRGFLAILCLLLQLLIKQALKNTSANSPVPETEPKGQNPLEEDT